MDVRIPHFRLMSALLLVGLVVPITFHGAVAPDKKKARKATAKPYDVSALLESVREQYDLPALGGAILEGDRVIAIGATGLRKSGAKEKVTTADRVWFDGRAVAQRHDA